GVASRHQCIKGERRIAKPAVTVVPIPYPSEMLRKGRGSRGNDPSGWCVGQRFESNKRTQYRISPLPFVRTPAGPILPPAMCLEVTFLPVALARFRFMGRSPCQFKCELLPL